jgi:hypothetical protein
MMNSLQPGSRGALSVAWTVAAIAVLIVPGRTPLADEAPVALRAQTLTVPPSTQPVMAVDVRNRTQAPYQGVLTVTGPEDWRLSPTSREVTLAAGETASVPFSIERARNVAANEYPFQLAVTGAAGSVTHQQTVFVASAPYYKPTVDGRMDDWRDAIPITFTHQGRSTTVSTFWNRREFSLLVAVQEQRLVPFQAVLNNDSPPAPDAIQFSFSPLESAADGSANGRAGRFEYLIMAAADGARCFELATPDTALEQVRRPRALDDLAYDDAQVVVRREGDLTVYECSLSFRPMRDLIRPMEGREFYFSVLVHDPDETGVRDLGRAAGLWPSPEDADAWSRWIGAAWGDSAPRGNRVRWGLCTSKY